MEIHHNALLKLGYLEERVFLLSNREPAVVSEALLFSFGRVFTNETEPIDAIAESGTNSITIIAPRENMVAWEKLIREADVPESGK
jgi:hypothetical protein